MKIRNRKFLIWAYRISYVIEYTRAILDNLEIDIDWNHCNNVFVEYDPKK